MSLFSGSDSGDLSDDSGGPADPGTRLSSIELSDDDSSDGLFVRQDEIKPEDTHNDGGRPRSDNRAGGGESDDDDTDSLDESSSGSDIGSDMDTEDELQDRANARNAVVDLDDSDHDTDDDDDSLMIVSENDLPEHIKEKFAAAGPSRPPGLFQFKMETTPDGDLAIPPDSDDGSESGSDPDFETSDDDLSDGERPEKRRRSAPKRHKTMTSQTHSPQPVAGDGEQPANEQWRMPTEDELVELFARQEALNMLKDQRPLTLQERLDLARISGRITALENMAQAMLGEEQEGHEAPGHASSRALSRAASHAPSEGHQPAGDGARPRGRRGGQQQRRSLPKKPKTPKEYWQREYAEHGTGLRNINAARNKRKRQPAGQPRNHGRGNLNASQGPDEAMLISMLRDRDPVMARAVQGAVPLPGAIRATTRRDQFKAFQERIMESPNLRSVDSQVKSQMDNKNLEEAVQSWGYRKARAHNGQWIIPGMKSPLYNHQMVAASWILRQEFSPEPPYGGMLCDEVGLGKTVEILAGMSGNRPTREDIAARRHQTLIVAPAPVIEQWKREIEKHCDETFIRKVHHYKMSQDVGPEGPEGWQTADILLASYHEIARAYPSDEDLRIMASKKQANEDWEGLFKDKVGPLLCHQFFRVILDEGHHIRNKATKTSRACIQLTSKYRWILSGTPLHNSVSELYAYFRFLGAKWSKAHEESVKNFGRRDKSETWSELEKSVASFILRRHAEDKFLGAPILEIPPTHKPLIIWVDATVEERIMNHRLEARFRDNINTDLPPDTAERKMTTFLAYFTRLRQGNAHPYLLEGTLAANYTLEDFHHVRRALARVGGRDPQHRQLQRWVEMEYERALGGDGDAEGFGKGSLGGRFEIDGKLEALEAGKRLGEVICRICYHMPVGAVITECGHSFCSECLEGALEVDPSCPTCKGVLVYTESPEWEEGEEEVDDSDDEEVEDSDDEEAAKKKKNKKHGGRLRGKGEKPAREIGDDENWLQPRMRDRSTWIKEYDDNYPNEPLMGSAKTVAVKNQVLLWQREAPDDKIIIFVQWAKLACILGRMLFEEDIPFLYYFGDLWPDQKTRAIDNFTDNPDIKVLIASIRCGGQGLNLTAANRVISVDQWWNSTLEQQAFGRVHRIGQKKETYFAKILVNDSIDEWFVRMGKSKSRKISAVLHEDEGVDGGRTGFTLEEAAEIFRMGEEVEETDGGDDEEEGVRRRRERGESEVVGGESEVVVLDGDESEGDEEVVVDADEQSGSEVVVVDGEEGMEPAEAVVGLDQSAGEEVVIVDGDESPEEPEVVVIVDGDEHAGEEVAEADGDESMGTETIVAPAEGMKGEEE